MIWLIGLVAVAALAGVVYVRAAPLPATQAPLEATPPDSPNWALAIPDDMAGAVRPTHVAPSYAASPAEVLAALDQVAAEDPNTAPLAAPAGPDSRAFVQRSAWVGWPDLITAFAIERADGRTTLALYSRSIYGHSDLGVNAGRLERWIAALDARLPRAD